MPITCDRLNIPLGSSVFIEAVDWAEFGTLFDELSDRRESRVAYRDGVMSLTVLDRDHERSEEVVRDFIDTLFRELGIEFYGHTAPLLKKSEAQLGIELAKCFYIKNPQNAPRESPVDLAVSPVPDLVIEADCVPNSYCEIYAELGIPELWKYGEDWVEIQSLNPETKLYKRQWKSDYFPGLMLSEGLPDFLERVDGDGYNTTLRAFREWVRKQVVTAAE